MDPKLVLQAPFMYLITASTDPMPYYGVLWTDAVTPFEITIQDYEGTSHTFDIDKFAPAIAPLKVTAKAGSENLFLLHNKNKATLPG